MAVTLTLAAPTTTDESISATNVIGAEIIGNVVAAYEGPISGTDQEKAAFFMQQLRIFLREVNHAEKKNAGREQSDADIDAAKTDFS